MNERLSILVAEDDQTLQDMLGHILPYEVTSAFDGEECVRLLKERKFDLLLLDIMLPKISGVVLLRTLKADYPHLLVVVMTGYADSIRQQVLAMGVDAFLEKPFGKEDVLSAIQRALGRRRNPAPKS